MRRGTCPLIAVVLALVLGACGGDDGPAGSESERALTAQWWNWAASQPADSNPITDPDGSRCGVDQPDDVFFLATSFEPVERRCDVPAGTELFAPVISEVCSPDTICDLGGADASATLDGEPLEVVRIENDEFDVTGVADNPITFASETVGVVADGHWARVGPLEPGEHTLELNGSDDSGLEIDITYHLVVG